MATPKRTVTSEEFAFPVTEAAKQLGLDVEGKRVSVTLRGHHGPMGPVPEEIVFVVITTTEEA